MRDIGIQQPKQDVWSNHANISKTVNQLHQRCDYRGKRSKNSRLQQTVIKARVVHKSIVIEGKEIIVSILLYIHLGSVLSIR